MRVHFRTPRTSSIPLSVFGALRCPITGIEYITSQNIRDWEEQLAQSGESPTSTAAESGPTIDAFAQRR